MELAGVCILNEEERRGMGKLQFNESEKGIIEFKKRERRRGKQKREEEGCVDSAKIEMREKEIE